MQFQDIEVAITIVSAVIVGATGGALFVARRERARDKEVATIQASIAALRAGLPSAIASGLVLAAGEGSGPPLASRRSYLMQLPGAASLSAAERSARQDVALKVRGIAQDIGVLSDAYCAGPNDDAPDPEKLGHVLGRWEDRLVAVADELDAEGSNAPDVEGEGEPHAHASESRERGRVGQPGSRPSRIP